MTRGFHMEVSEAAKVVDVYSALAANTAVSQQELAIAMSKTASSMESVGSTFEETSAMISTMVAVTRESATNIGSAMKSIASRYGELTKDPKALYDSEGDEMSFNKVDKALKSVGISLQTADHQFRDFTDVILELADAWSTLDSAQQRYIATQFAGNRQQSRFLALVSNADLIRENIKVAEESEDTGTLQALKALDSLESKLNQVQVAYQQFYTSIGAEQLWKSTLGWIKNFIDSLNSLPKVFNIIPLNAGTVIYDTITLLKKGMTEAFVAIIQQIQNSGLLEAWENKGRQEAEAHKEGVIDGIRQSAPQIQEALQEGMNPPPAAQANQITEEEKNQITEYFESKKNYWKEKAEEYRQEIEKTQQELEKTQAISTIRTFALLNNSDGKGFGTDGHHGNKEDLQLMKDALRKTKEIAGYTTGSLEELDVAIKHALDAQTPEDFKKALIEIKNATENFDQSKLENIRDTLNDLTSSAKKADVLSGTFERMGNFASFAGERIASITNAIKKNNSQLNDFSMALNIVANAINKSDQAGQIFAGSLMTIAGAVRAVTAVFKEGGISWLGLAMGAIGIINGIATAYETAEEKIERLSKEAEKLNNEAKKVKADYNTIQRTADKIDELKVKRYESIEAEQEYQTAVEELAEKVPSLIVGLDDAGNVIVDTANLEYELEKAREAAAEATLKAAQAEREKAQVDLENAKKQQNKLHEEIINSSDITASSWQAMYSSNSNIWDLPNDKDIQKQWAKLMQGYYTGQGAYYDVIQSLNSIFKQRGTDNTGLGSDEFGRLDIINTQDFLTALNSISDITEEYNQLIESFKNGLGDIEIREHYDEINMAIAALNDNNNKTEEELKNEIINIKELISTYQLWGDYESFIKIADEYITGIKTIQELEEALGSTQTTEISAAIQGLEKTETDFLKNKEGRNVLATSWIQRQAEAYANNNGEYATDSKEYKERFEEYLKYNLKDDFNDFRDLLSEEQWKLLDNNWDKLDSYSVSDLATLLGLEEGEDPFLAVLNDYYTEHRPLERIKENLNSKMTHIIGKEYSDFDTLSDISKDMESFMSNGLDLYEEYFKEGYSSIGQTLLDNMFKVTEEQQHVAIESRGTVADILENMSYTHEGVQKAIDQLKDINGTEKVQFALETLRDSMLNNLPLAIQTAIDEISSSVDETVDSITKAYKGFSKFSDAKAYIDKLNALAGEALYGLNDLKWDGSKYTVSKKIQQEGIKLEKEQVEKRVADINSMITAGLESANKGYKQMYLNAAKTEGGVGKLPSVMKENTAQLNNILKNAGLITINEETNEFTLSEDFKKAIEEAGDNFDLIKFLEEYLKEQLKDLEAVEKLIENNEESLKNESKKENYQALIEAGTKYAEGFESKIDIEDYFKQLGVDLEEQDYSYNEALGRWVFSARAFAKIRRKLRDTIYANGGEFEDAVNAAGQSIDSLLANIDVNGYFSSNKTAKDEATLRQAYDAWYQTLTDRTGKLTTDAFMAAIKAGGEQAVEAAERIAKERGEKLSTSDVETIYRSEEVKKLLEAGEQLDKSIGDIIDSKAKEILEVAGYYTDKLSDNSYIITSLGNVETAYNLYFDELIENAQATATEIDEARKNIINAHNDKREKNKEFIDNLSDLEIGMYTNIASEMERIGINPVATSRDYFNKNFLPENYNGNVDLFRRLRVPIEDSYGTVFSFWEDINGIAATFASITQDGILLSDQEINSYLDDLRDSGAKTEAEIKAYDAQHLNLFIGIGEDLGEYVHNLQEEWDNVVFNGKDISSEEMSKYDAFHNLEDNLAKVGAYIEDGILKTTENSDPLGINKAFEKYYQSLVDTAESEEFKSQNEKFLAQVKDSIEDFINNYVELINNGISGELSNTQALDLEKFANNYGLKIDFTETAEGLKLSEKSARDLYLTLREVDSVRAKLVFDKLAESLEKTNSNYKDIFSITARIVELEKEINNPKISTARREEYQKELEVAKEIQETRSLTDPDTFNFMGKELPDGLKGPDNFWKSTREAYESMNKAGKNGYMAFQDWYNLANFIEDCAKVAGTSFDFAGHKIGEGASSAADLITMGANALANVDEEGSVVSFKRLGNSFKNGAEDMASDFDVAVKTVAKSQIKMLDAMISMLELVVSMENLDEVSGADKKLDFSELFPFYSEDDPTNFNLDEKGKKGLQGILDASETNKDLANALDTFMINGVSMRKRLKEAISGNIKDKNTADLFWATLAGLQEAMRSGDYSPESIKETTIAFLQKQLDEDQWSEYTLTDGTRVQVTSNGYIEQSKDGKWTINGGTHIYNTPEEAKKGLEFLKKTGIEGVFKDGKISGTIELTNNSKIKVTENNEGEIVYTVDGVVATDKKDAIKKAILKARGEDINGSENYNITEDDIVEYEMIAKFNLTGTEVANLTGKPIGQLTDDVLADLGLDIALINSIEAAIERAFTNINLGQLILDGLLTPSDKEAIAFDEKDIGNNPKLVELGRQLGVGIILAIQNGISEANTGDGENTTGKITASVVQGLEDGQTDVEEAAGHVADSAANPFKKLIDPNSSDSFKIWGMSAVEQFIDGFNVVDSNGTSNFAEIFGSSFLSSIREALTGQEMYNAGQAAADMFTQGFSNIGGGETEQTSTVAQKITDPIRTAIQDLFSKETLDQLVKDFETNSTIALSFDHIDVGKLTEAATNVETTIDIVVNALNDLKNALNNLPDKSFEVQNTANAIDRLHDKSYEVNSTAAAIDNLHSRSIQVSANVHVDVSGVTTSWWDSGWTYAKGNIQIDGLALANGTGKKTLMGELGPELVVSGGRYYVVGQNGAEMVDLPDDAIVFNHLQTKQLLTSGTSSRGTPSTNERNAVSYATGNITGPAMASASEVLATLKEIRAMWQSMLTASAKQLGSQAGISANKNKNNKDNNIDTVAEDGTIIKTTTAEIQRWYNLLRQIDKTEKDITYQENLQTQYQSKRVADGKALYKSYKEELSMLEQQVKRSEELSRIQKDWYDIKRAELAASAYGKIFTYTEDGLQQYVDGANRGLDILEKLTEKDIWGNPTGIASSAESQLKYLKNLGFDLNDLLSENDGTKAASFVFSPGYMLDNNGETLTGQDLVNAQVSIMENFWDTIDGWRDELDSLYDSYREQLNNVLENQNKQNDLMQKVIDNQIDVEDTVLQAIIDARQATIDAAEEEKEAYQKSTDKFIKGLNDAISKERKLYEDQQNKNELNKLQRQLAILQRTGGSTTQISNLQKQITEKQQNMYFDEKEEQIKVIQDSSNLQIEKLETQINIMNETLEYQKENGLLWKDVYDVMVDTPERILAYISENSKDWGSNSALKISQDIAELKTKIQLFTESRDDNFISSYYNINSSNKEKVNNLNNYSEVTSSNVEEPVREIPILALTNEMANKIPNLNSEQINVFRDNLNNSASSQNTLLRSIEELQLQDSIYQRISSNDETVNIDRIELNMNVSQISNDYDARRAGQNIMNEMLRTARKSGARGVSRR